MRRSESTISTVSHGDSIKNEPCSVIKFPASCAEPSSGRCSDTLRMYYNKRFILFILVIGDIVINFILAICVIVLASEIIEAQHIDRTIRHEHGIGCNGGKGGKSSKGIGFKL